MIEGRSTSHGPRRSGLSVPSPGAGLILRLARGLQLGQLDLQLPNGSWQICRGSEPGPHGVLQLRRGRLARRYIVSGSVGFAEGYIHGDWDSPDLATLLELLDRNADAWGDDYYAKGPMRWVMRLQHALRSNSKSGSRRNIQAHYDLGNAFFEAWLDPSMTYSSALFEPETDDLEAAQAAKYRRLAQAIGVQRDQHLLEIGSGWGGFALTAAKEFGAKVTSVTISREQHAYASRRVFDAGLNERVEIRLQDYRDIDGRYDRLASIEMFEAVGEKFWPVFFDRLRDRLTPDGVAGLQVITIADRYFEVYRQGVDFIQKYIFPGGMLPSLGALEREFARAGLTRTGLHAFGHSYARTLGEWNRRFQAAWPQVRPLGFDERFRRIWIYYLALCEAGFRTGSTDVVQVTLRPS